MRFYVNNGQTILNRKKYMKKLFYGRITQIAQTYSYKMQLYVTFATCFVCEQRLK